MVQKVNSFPLSDEHTVVLGKTRSGKTYGTLISLDRCSTGVFFFNTLHTPLEKGSSFVTGSGDNSFEQIVELLKAGRKVNFLPSTDLDIAEKQLQYLVNEFYNYGELDMYFVVDEVHLMKKFGLNAMRRIATAGLRYGYKGVWISQRPANVHNDLLSQATMNIVFNLKEHDRGYLESHMPIYEMQEKINNEKYIFATYDDSEVKAPLKIE